MRSLNKIFIIIIVLLTFIFCHTILAQEKEEKKGKIKKFEKELEKTKADSSKRQISHEEDESSFFDFTLLFNLFIGSSDDDDSFLGVNFWNSYFSDYPYQTRNVGLYASSETTEKRFSMKLFGNYFYNSADLQGFDF
jgi:hypothetical protein